MRKIIVILLSAALVLTSLCACAKQEATPAETTKKVAKVIDLTEVSDTVAYSKVTNMLESPTLYVGEKVKMRGQFVPFKDELTGKMYYLCTVSDATACCEQGMEFVLAGEYNYPDDYPEERSEIEVTGDFNTYTEDGNRYCHLENAIMKESP